MTRWTAADVQKANARVRKAKAPRVTQENFDKLKAIQQDVERIGKSDRGRRKRLGIKRKPTPVLVPINNALHLGQHRYTWWHWRQAYVCPCGLWVSGETLKRLEAT